jgi:hypothetical protein
LYDIEYPLDKRHRPGCERNLRGARIVMEFEKPRTICGLGIWEYPGAPPNTHYALECCDTYEVDEMTEELEGDWKLAGAVRRNQSYYHLHGFEPKKAKVWRLTIIGTHADMQRIAEVELYEKLMDNLFDLDVQDDAEDAFDFDFD